MPRLTADFLRQRYPQLSDASDADIARLAHQALAPDQDYRPFEDQFLGKSSVATELGRGVVRGVRSIKGGWDFLAGGLAGVAGDDKASEEAFQSFDNNTAAANRLAPRRRFSEIQSAGDAVDFAAGIGGEAVPALVLGGVAGVAGAGAAGGLSTAAQVPSRVNYLMPHASPTQQSAAAAGMVFVGGAADAFVPARILAGAAKPGLGGVVRDVALGSALGGLTPVAERAIAATASGDFGAFDRGGVEQVGQEMLEGGAAGGVSSAVARPVIHATQWARDRIGQRTREQFPAFSRTETGDIDLTQQVVDAQADRTPAVFRRGGAVDWTDQGGTLAGQTPDMFGGEGMLLSARPEVAPEQLARSHDRRQMPLDFSPEAPSLYSTEDGLVGSVPSDVRAAMLAEDRVRAARSAEALAAARPGQTVDLFDGIPRYPASVQEAPQADVPVVQNRRQVPLDFTPESQPIVVTRDGEAITGGVENGLDTLRYRQLAEERQRQQAMASAESGQVVDMFSGRPGYPAQAPELENAPPALSVPDQAQHELPGMVTKGRLLQTLQAASRDTGISAFRGQTPLGGKSPTGLRAVLDAQDPIAAMREAYASGAHSKAELIDKWHERLVGRRLSEPERAAAEIARPTRPVEIGERFAASQDLQARGLKGMAKLREALRRSQDDEMTWNLKEDIKEFTQALRTADPAQRRATVDALEKRVLQLRAYSGRADETGRFGPGFMRQGPAVDKRMTGEQPRVNASASTEDNVTVNASTRQRGSVRSADVDAVGALRSTIERAIGATLPPYTVRAAGLRNAKAVQKLANAFGVSVVGYTTDGRKSLASYQGATRIAGAPGVVFVRADSQLPHRLIFGHELVHQIAEKAPDLYDALVSTMERTTSEPRARDYHRALVEKHGYRPDEAPEEMTANVVGHLFATDKAFLRQFGRKSPEFIRPLLDFLSKMLDQLKARLGMDQPHRDPEIESMITDLEALKRGVARTLQEFARRSANTKAENPDQASFLRRAEEGDPKAVGYAAAKGISSDIADQIRDGLSSGKQGAFERALGLMTTEQIAEQFGSKVRGANSLVEALGKRFGAPFGMAAQGDAVVKRVLALPEYARKQLADLMFAATEAEIHPDRPLTDSIKKPTQGDEQAHAILVKKYEALPKGAKDAYQEARKLMDKQFADITGALRRLVARVEPDPTARAARLQQINDMVGRTKGPYFPLTRFGDFVLVAKGAASDGRSIVQHFETKSAMERARAELIKGGASAAKVVMTRRDDPRLASEVNAPFVESLRQAIDTNIDDPDQRAALSQALNDLVLQSLPAAYGAKNFIRRRNVQGYSTDAARALADSVTRAERYVANLNFTPDVNAALTDLRQFHTANAEQMPIYAVVYQHNGKSVVSLYPSATERLHAMDALLDKGIVPTTLRAPAAELTERLAGVAPDLKDKNLKAFHAQATAMRDKHLGGPDMTTSQAVANHLLEKATTMTRGRADSPTLKALGRLAHVAYLGMSPAYWATNLAQVPTLTFPELAGRYGEAKAAKAITRASKAASHAFKLMADHLSSGRGTGLDLDGLKDVSADERAALRYLADHGMLDITQNVDLLAVAEGEAPWKRTALEYITAGAHYTELFNRMVTGLASYRLASAAGDSHSASMEAALRSVSRTQFNYADWNKPRYFQTTGPLGQLARPLLMFQQYAQNTLYWWGSNVRRAVQNKAPGDRREATKAMLLAGVGLTVLGGAAALPLAGTVHLMTNLVAQAMADDPGYDVERELQQALQDMGASPRTATALLRGSFTLAGVDLSQRIGQGDLLPGLTKQAKDRIDLARDPSTAWAASLLGPTGSLMLSFAKAFEAAQDGDMLTALEAFPVKGAADLARAYGYATRGIRNRAGLTLVPPEDLSASDIAIRGLGAEPLSASSVREDARDVTVVQKRLDAQKSSLLQAVVSALTAGDHEGVRDGIAAIGRYNQVIGQTYPQAQILAEQIEQALNRAMHDQSMLSLTGGRYKNLRTLQLARELDPGSGSSAGRVPGVFSGGAESPDAQ
ncbi:MAG: PLxRFG domain-containing protein [Pseudomonadota bacterium]